MEKSTDAESTPPVKEAISRSASTEITPDQYIDVAAERRLVRKLDLYIIWIVMLLYLLSFLDRVNIGNARLFGLEEASIIYRSFYAPHATDEVTGSRDEGQ